MDLKVNNPYSIIFFVIIRAFLFLSIMWFGLTTKKHVFKRDWTTCSVYNKPF